MNLDWPVAFAFFIVFVTWSLVYFIDLQRQGQEGFGMDGLASVIMGSLLEEEHSIPVEYDSTDAGHAVLFADVLVPGGMGVEVTSGGSGLACMLSGDRVYWEADLDAGRNSFTIEYGNGLGGCSDSLDTSNANRTLPLSAVSEAKVSPSGLALIESEGYSAFRERMGLASEFRVEWDGPLQGSLGPAPPGNRDVHVKSFTRPAIGLDGLVTIRLMAWEPGL